MGVHNSPSRRLRLKPLVRLNLLAPVSPSHSMGLNVDEELFKTFGFYAGVVIFKMMIMALLTARQRFRTGTFISSEDIAGQEKKGYKTGVNEDVERVRRAHQNDIENIVPFGLLYIFTGPNIGTARLVFRIFVGSRILHTI